MTTAILATGTRKTDTTAPSGRSLEELVNRLMVALLSEETQKAAPTATPSLARSIHEARRLRQTRQIDDALAVLARVDMAKAETHQARWAFTEWKQLVRRRFGDMDAMVYSQGTGKAAALVPNGDGSLEVVAVLGMRWKPGKLVSRRSLRGLR
ncbi:MAG: hypothetical protein OXK79_04620, partial [Chloroflexota bacterium]|nr:hypothetical protein [Chloroflexota bacterium]